MHVRVVCVMCVCEDVKDVCIAYRTKSDPLCAHHSGNYILVDVGLSPGGKLLAVVHGSGCYNRIGQQVLWSRHGGIGRHTAGVLEEWGS